MESRFVSEGDYKSILKRIKRFHVRIIRLQGQKHNNMNKQRRNRTRELIKLGGLVTKANLNNLPSNVLYGIFLDAALQLDAKNGQVIERKWMRMGKEAFENDIKRKPQSETHEGP